MSKLTKIVAVLALVVYGLASTHCGLEGFGFLRVCCFVDSGSPSKKDCGSDECVVESGKYRTEEKTLSALQPLLVLARISSLIEAPLPEPGAISFVASESPPELLKVWQFFHRTALLPRAPSIAC